MKRTTRAIAASSRDPRLEDFKAEPALSARGQVLHVAPGLLLADERPAGAELCTVLTK